MTVSPEKKSLMTVGPQYQLVDGRLFLDIEQLFTAKTQSSYYYKTICIYFIKVKKNIKPYESCTKWISGFASFLSPKPRTISLVK